jgi:tetratricopeptide (TPR) repeat protein
VDKICTVYEIKGKGTMSTLSPESNQREHWMPALICLALVMVTIAAFWQLKGSGFVNFDDQLYVYENAYIQSGLNFDSIKLAFSSDLAKYSGHWHPLTWLSLMLDHSLFGLNPTGYHLVNLLFHVLNTVLLFLVLRRMTKTTWPGTFVAALFAIHPLHVESVAWVVERKDVLSTFFWMLTLGAYSYYVEQKTAQRYAFILLFFILGLMSKPMLVTLPFVLLLLDFWPLQRFSEAIPVPRIPAAEIKPEVSGKKKKSRKKEAEKAASAVKAAEVTKPAVPEFKWSLIYPLLLEKVPLFVLAVLSSIVTYVAAHSAGAVHSKAIPLFVRLGNAIVSYGAYIVKMIVPVNLAVLYPYPGSVIPWQVFGALLLLIAITAAVIWRMKQSPYLATGWLWYLGTLVPVIGIVQAGPQAMADRYTYISLIGLFIMMACGIAEVSQKWKYRKEALMAAAALCIFCFSILTWKQVGYWHDSLSLFNHALNVTKNNYRVHNMRGVAYADLGNFKQAIEDYSRAIEIEPGFPEAYYNRGKDYTELGNFKKAVEDYTKAIAIKPDYAMAYNGRGNAYFDLGNQREAIADYGRAIELKPDYPDAYFNRGNTFVHLGNYQEAIRDYSRAIEIKPDYTGAYKNRGIAYMKSGNNTLALNDLKTAAKSGDEQAKNFLRSKGINW